MTFPERLDAAQNGEEFAQALMGLFGALEAMMEDDSEDHDQD